MLRNLGCIGSVAIKFIGEPGNGAFLAVKFLFDKFSDVYHSAIKKGGTIHNLFSV